MSRPQALLVGVNRYPFLEDGDLRGCLNDVALFSSLLVDRFGFAAEDVRVLRDEEATRAAILGAFDELVARADSGGVAVFFFAGHGSRKRSSPPDATYVESIVPHDSGRGTHPSRDVEDREIDAFVQRLNGKTPHVTLIVDCCHSGSVTRDAFGEAVRGIAPPSDGGPPGEVRRSAWRLGEREAVVVAACEAHEQAGEHRVYRDGKVVRHGALTYYLAEALARSDSDATWREVFSPLRRALSEEHPGQHPQVEGRVDDVVFGRREIRPGTHLELTAAGGDEVELAGGAAHAVTVGSLWVVQPARAAGPAATLATVRIDDVKLVTSRGTVVERGEARALRPGDWARPAEPPEAATRYRHLLALENADPASRLRGRLCLTLLRYDAAIGGFAAAERRADGSVAFTEGERAEIEIANASEVKLWMSLVQLGADGAVELLLPVSGHPTFRLGGFGLGAGETLRLAAGYYAMDPRYRAAVRGGLVLRLSRGSSGGLLHLKLLATPRPVDFSSLEQGARRLAAPASGDIAGDLDWATETVTVRLTAQEPAEER